MHVTLNTWKAVLVEDEKRVSLRIAAFQSLVLHEAKRPVLLVVCTRRGVEDLSADVTHSGCNNSSCSIRHEVLMGAAEALSEPLEDRLACGDSPGHIFFQGLCRDILVVDEGGQHCIQRDIILDVRVGMSIRGQCKIEADHDGCIEVRWRAQIANGTCIAKTILELDAGRALALRECYAAFLGEEHERLLRDVLLFRISILV